MVGLALLMFFLATCSLWFPSRALLSANFALTGIVFAGNSRLFWTIFLADLFIGLSYVALSATGRTKPSNSH